MEMPSRRKKTSFVWKYFRVCETDETKAVCNHCGAVIRRGKDSRTYSTSALAGHVKRCRRDEFNKKNESSMIDVHLEEETSITPERRSSDKNCRNYVTVLPGIPQSSNDVICSRRVDLIHTAQVMDILYQQHKYGKFCDLMLISSLHGEPPTSIVKNDESEAKNVFLVHGSVIASVSANVKRLIEMGSRTIELEDVTPFGLKTLIEIIYTGKMCRDSPFGHHEIQQIWKAACDLGVTYAQYYLRQEHSQAVTWIQDEENEALESSDPSKAKTSSQEELSHSEGNMDDSNIQENEKEQFRSVDDSASSSFKGWSTGSHSPTEGEEMSKDADVVEIQI